MSQLSEGWAWCKLEDLVEFAIGGDWGKDLNHFDDGFIEVRCIRGTELRNWQAELGRSAAARKVKESSLEKRRLAENDLIVEISGGGPEQPVGRTVRIVGATLDQHAPVPVVCTNFFRKVRLALPDTAPFVELFQRFDYSIGGTIGIQSGSNNLRNLNFNSFLAKQLPLAPLAEQKRIVRKLNTLSARTTTARIHLTAIEKLVEKYKRGIYDYHFANAGERVPLGDLAKVGTGATPKKGNPRYYDHGNVPWVTSGAVNDKTVNEPSGYITETALTETNCKLFPAGSLLMAMYGEGKTRGQVARLGIEAATNQALAVIHEIDVQKVNVDYLYLFLDSIYLEIRELAEGGVQPNLSLGKVKSFELPLPSVAEQQKTVIFIEAAFAKIDRQAAEAEKALKLTERLDERTLAKAFAGELVPQDPNNEPASALLERIREARSNTPKKPMKKPTRAKAMKVAPKERVLTDSAEWPEQGLPFEDIAKRVSLPHDVLKDAVFALLEGDHPKLRQQFDTDDKVMKLLRVTS